MAKNVTDNGNAYSGSNIRIILGITEIGITKISFGDKVKPEVGRRIGSMQQDVRTDGEYETDEGSMTLEVAEYYRLLSLLPDNGYTLVEFPVSGSYDHPTLGHLTFRLDRTRIVSDKESIESTAKISEIDVGIHYMQVFRNGKTKNRIRGKSTAGTSRL
jgi:hypothetical protein